MTGSADFANGLQSGVVSGSPRPGTVRSKIENKMFSASIWKAFVFFSKAVFL